MNTASPKLRSADDIGPFAGDPALGWTLRLRRALAEAPEADRLLLVAPGVSLDADALALLNAALRADPEAEAASPIGTAAVRRAWSLPDEADATLEAWTWSPHAAVAAAPDPRCALWTRAGAERALATGPAATRALRLPHLAVPLPDADDAPGPNAEHRPAGLAVSVPRPTAAGRDGRPVVLHVLHDWGGGVERFVHEAMRGDAEAHHLALVSGGDLREGFGQRLSLHTDLDRCPIRLWTCDPPVGDMAIAHPTVRKALEQVAAEFAVSEVRVSSLIGTSLDVLATGLPTRFVVHDPFPFWPVLDDRTASLDGDPASLAAACAAPDWRFACKDPQDWATRRDATLRALADHGVPLVAPSRAALDRLAPLLPNALQASAGIIPHGIALPRWRRPARRREGPLRVLVPGRLAGAKGETLLDALLPLAPSGIAWCFAGGGEAATRFAERTGGEAVLHYEPDALPGLVERFDPDLALLPSLLPETFGYVLSEMQALGVPVLAAAVGAYAERIDAATQGLATLAPEAAAFAEALAACVARPEALPRQLPPPPDIDTARAAWGLAPAAPTPLPLPARDADVVGLQQSIAMIRAGSAQLRKERDEAYAAYDRDTGDLIRQRDVAVSRSEDLMQELAHERSNFEAARIRECELVEDLASKDAAISRHDQQLAEMRAQRDEAYGFYERDTADLVRQRDTALSQRDAAEHQLAQAQRTLAHPLIRLPLGLARRLSNGFAAARYRLHRGRDLLGRGLKSLRRRGPRATWEAVRRRFAGASEAVPTATPPAAEIRLAFAVPSQVRASLVIPVHGKLAFTMACLKSLAGTGLPGDVEVIVIDDASPDDTDTVLPPTAGLRYHRNARNLGFVGSCNAGAAMARGEFLVFLNNDTTLTPGWLEKLLATFDSHPDTGLVGAQLVYPDGRLQESGGIVFADGSGWNYGRFEDPRHPAYTFVREVDYCSGAAIALRRALFERLGGFDDRYAPAYYEDTDLAMKVREAGLKVRVQPASVVVHHEGVTAGTDTSSGVKAYQVRNQQRFLERWGDTLKYRHPAPSQAPHYAAQHRARARVLVIDATTPMPDRDSGSVRLFELLRLLVDEGCAVTFFPENGLDDGRYTKALRAIGVEAWTQPWLGALPDWLAKHGPRFQLIVVSRHYVLSPLLPLLRRHAPQARIVFDTVDLHHLREQREATERKDPALMRAAERTRSEELALIRAVDRTWVVSPVEKALLADAVPPAVVDVVSNIHRVRGPGPAMRERKGLIFVGGFRHPPNVDAALWLADDILPRIRAVRPDITLSLVGSDAPPEVMALAEREGIEVHGFVPDLEPLLDRHRFSVAPLRYGAGVKGKVNQALAHGLPVVATRCAVEGMGLEHGVDALVADDAEAFAAAVLAAYEDETLWRRLVDGGLANTEREFSPERARQTLRTIFAGLR